jgi:phospholipase/carboxylesterase
MRFSRREFMKVGASALVSAPLGCLSTSAPDGGNPRLTARPHAPTTALTPGEHALGLGSGRDGFVYIPSGYRHATPAPLAVVLHGAGQSSEEWATAKPVADQLGIVLLAPDARGLTWDLVRGSFGPDVQFINAALNRVFDRANIDAAHIAISGFSDGASYALSIGMPNGDLFTHILAFSPGFVIAPDRHGMPLIYVTHGTNDQVLAIEGTSRRIVADLRANGYTVQYQEFDGGHELPPTLGTEVFRWFVG